MTVGAGDVASARVEENVRDCDACRADAGHHDLHVLDPLAHDLERVDKCREGHDRGAVLVVVEHRDVECLLEPALDLEAAWGRDVLEVDAAERRRDGGANRDDLVDVLGRQAEREGVDSTELLEQDRLPLHHRHRRLRADVAEPEHRGAVRDDRDGVPLDREVPGRLAILGDRGADPGDARGVGHREVVARLERHLRGHLDLAAEMHQERAIGDALDLDPVDLADGGDDPLEVLGARSIDGDVAHLGVPLDADEIDRTE